jgi:N-acylneuraminate cytidylyltransferase
MSKHKTIIIIPARGGSKRMANKNVQFLGDYPLVAHSILYAKQNLSLIDAIYVSTNDETVKAIANQHGVEVIHRPEHLSGDMATTVSALKHVLESLNKKYDTVILLQPTNPLRPKVLLREAFMTFVNNDCDSLMTVSRNYQKLGKIVNERFVPFNYVMGQRSQDLEPLYYENGLLYIIKASLIFQDKILGDHNLPFIVNHPYAHVDIDTEEDLRYAEIILKQYPNA